MARRDGKLELKKRCYDGVYLWANLLKVQARNTASTNGVVKRYMPHFVHLYLGVEGSSDMASMPMNGGIVADAITYMRLFLTRRVQMPTTMNIETDKTTMLTSAYNLRRLCLGDACEMRTEKQVPAATPITYQNLEFERG